MRIKRYGRHEQERAEALHYSFVAGCFLGVFLFGGVGQRKYFMLPPVKTVDTD